MLAATLERALPLVPSALEVPLSEAVGGAAYRISTRARSAVRANLEIVAPERMDRERLVRATFVAQVRHYIEIFRLLRWSPERLLRTVDVVGWDGFERARARGNGVIMASAHLGPVSICGQVFTAHGIPITMPVENEVGAFARAVNRARTSMGMRFVETESARGIYRVLRDGGVLGLLADRAVTGVGERVLFFGRETLLPSAHIALALRSGAALIPAFARRTEGRYVAQFEAPLELERTGDHARDLREGVGRFAALMEPHIRRAPEEWSVFEALWDR